MIELTKQDRIDDAAREDDEMLIRRFVGAIGYDYIQHYKKHTAQIHPDFSEETRIFWRELESRLKGTTVLDFDREGALAELKEMGKRQAEMCKEGSYASSYHYGLKSAYYEAMRIIENHTKKGNSHDD